MTLINKNRYTKGVFFHAQPFPHIIIDDWLQPKLFQEILVRYQHKLSYHQHTPALSFNTKIERRKSVFDLNSDLGMCLLPIVQALISPEWLIELQWLMDDASLRPLTELQTPDTQYKYIHLSEPGGYLGAHVDHCQLYDKNAKIVMRSNIHTLNCIFYVYGEGTTELYGPSGWGKPLKMVEAKPNRLLIFRHDSRAFHGGGEVKSQRTTIYMDYYSHISKVNPANYWQHATTFVPKDWKSLRRYLPGYLRWMMRKQLV